MTEGAHRAVICSCVFRSAGGRSDSALSLSWLVCLSRRTSIGKRVRRWTQIRSKVRHYELPRQRWYQPVWLSTVNVSAARMIAESGDVKNSTANCPTSLPAEIIACR